MSADWLLTGLIVVSAATECQSKFISGPLVDYRPTLTCSKGPGCAMDVPSETLEGIDRRIICAGECFIRNDCVSFNYLEKSRSCLLFNITPYKIVHIEECTGYDKLDKSETPEELIRAGDNLAKHRRSCQTMTAFYEGFILSSWLALDDLYGTDLTRGMCSATVQSDSSNNWFMVDLARHFSIGLVRILSPVAVETDGDRHVDLEVGITNTSWLVESPVRGAYPLCGFYSGPQPNAVWVDVHCQPQPTLPSRFVTVQQTIRGYSHHGGHMSLCELQVYGVRH